MNVEPKPGRRILYDGHLRCMQDVCVLTSQHEVGSSASHKAGLSGHASLRERFIVVTVDWKFQPCFANGEVDPNIGCVAIICSPANVQKPTL
jgi:hypothetical protein